MAADSAGEAEALAWIESAPGEALVTLFGRPAKGMADQLRTVGKTRLSNPAGRLSVYTP